MDLPPTSDADTGQPVDLQQIWNDLVAEIDITKRAWLDQSRPVSPMHGNTVLVEVANDFARNQIEGRLRAQLEDALTARFKSASSSLSFDCHGDGDRNAGDI